jgi:CPA2 family monovalent cation:H+ antiporter-2
VRTHSEEEAELLEKENAGKIFLGEGELARNMSQYVLHRYAVKAETVG